MKHKLELATKIITVNLSSAIDFTRLTIFDGTGRRLFPIFVNVAIFQCSYNSHFCSRITDSAVYVFRHFSSPFRKRIPAVVISEVVVVGEIQKGVKQLLKDNQATRLSQDKFAEFVNFSTSSG